MGGDTTDLFLVCGLGSLGQYCVSVLKEFAVAVSAIDVIQPQHWDIPDLADRIDTLLTGDCRQSQLLEKAGIRRCRAVLLVTSDERVNIAAAFAARSLNSDARLVVRSAQDNLNELLSQHLGNFVAFEATQLAAPSFALAALDSETQGLFTLDHNRLRVSTVQLAADHRWCDRRQLFELNTAMRRVLQYGATVPPAATFYDWEPNTRIHAGDTLTYIELTEAFATAAAPVAQRRKQPLRLNLVALRHRLRQHVRQFWQDSNQTQRVALVSSLVMVSIFLSGAVFYKLQYPDISLQEAFNVSLVLVIGGYDNMFGALHLPFTIPPWLHLFSVGATVAGTVFIGILYAILTERVLAARFQFLKRRPPIPQANHIVLIGLGRVGQRVGTLLQQLKQPLVGVRSTPLDPELLPQLPLVAGSMRDALKRVNLVNAKSVVVVTDDEVANLEIALMARTVNRSCNLVLRTTDPLFAENVARLLPDARVFGAYALAAEAFAGAAFGENILNLFRLNNRTTLVTEYTVAVDTLYSRLLAEVAYGYGVVPILHQRGREAANLMPSDDVRLRVGDRLVVLATITGLQRIERGLMHVPEWQVQVEKAVSEQARFEGANTIARISGCEIGIARDLMHRLPDTLAWPLFKHQAQRLVRELGKVQVLAHLVHAP